MRLLLLVIGLAIPLACAGGVQAPAADRDSAGGANAEHTHPPGTGPHTHADETPVSGKGIQVQPALASSVLTVGRNRFVFGLVSAKTGAPIAGVPEVEVQFFKVHPDGRATKTGDADAVYHSENLPAGVFVTRTSFDEAGAWGALLTVRPKDGKAYGLQMDFKVVADSPVPGVGEAAPPSKNLTKKDVKSLSEIDSAAPHDDMHDLTIAEAVRSGKPTLVLFATPGFCETATCGPDLQVAQALEKKYRGRANFIHIETPSNEAAPQAQMPTVQQWGLTSEPWIFLIDRNGRVADRFEGGLTLAEVGPAFSKVVR